MTIFLTFGLVLLSTAPVLAEGQGTAVPRVAVNIATSVQSFKTNPSLTQLAIPEPAKFGLLGDEELELVTGDGLGCAVAGAAFGIAVGAAISFYAWATGHNPSSALQAAYETVVGGIVSSAAGSAAAAACTVF